jgi:hypothetical protein
MMIMVGITSARDADEQAEYRKRTVANFVAAAFVGFLMVSGYWIVSTLAG